MCSSDLARFYRFPACICTTVTNLERFCSELQLFSISQLDNNATKMALAGTRRMRQVMNVENAHGHPIAKQRRLGIKDFMGRSVPKLTKTAEAFAHECNKEELIKLIGEDEKLGRQLVQAAKYPQFVPATF